MREAGAGGCVSTQATNKHENNKRPKKRRRRHYFFLALLQVLALPCDTYLATAIVAEAVGGVHGCLRGDTAARAGRCSPQQTTRGPCYRSGGRSRCSAWVAAPRGGLLCLSRCRLLALPPPTDDRHSTKFQPLLSSRRSHFSLLRLLSSLSVNDAKREDGAEGAGVCVRACVCEKK